MYMDVGIISSSSWKKNVIAQVDGQCVQCVIGSRPAPQAAVLKTGLIDMLFLTLEFRVTPSLEH